MARGRDNEEATWREERAGDRDSGNRAVRQVDNDGSQ